MFKSKIILLNFVLIGILIMKIRWTDGLLSLDNLMPVTDLLLSGLNYGKEIRFLHYTGPDIESAETNTYAGHNVGEFLKHIDLAKPLVLYIHGFNENRSSESVRTVADAYLRRGDHNFGFLDWSDYAFDLYPIAIIEIEQIAKYIAKVLDVFVENGFFSESLHIVGHSMGAQLAGYIGKFTSFQVPRITGLDPASPGYYQFNKPHLNPTNARFVDVIHTDGGFYGAYPATGTVDCFANGGIRPQPGCSIIGIPLTPKDLCSHWRSWRFWAESLLDERAFLAVKCSSYKLFLTGRCNGNERQYCGYIMSNKTREGYHFLTNAKSPFGIGESRIHPN